MNTLRTALVLVVCSFALLSGCGTEQTTAPGDSDFDPRLEGVRSSKKVGLVSELVLCLDVSDSTNAEELQAIVSGALACLGDESIVARDGSVSVGIVVYADTSAIALAPLTPLTSESLPNAITGALEGLLQDRLVGTPGADMAAGLEAAAALSSTSGTQNRHVVLVGDGRADDAVAAEASCSALAAQRFMISAIGVGDDETGSALLASCAAQGGGLFRTTQEADLESVCREVLAYAVQANLVVEPESITAAKDGSVELAATLFRGMDPSTHRLPGVEIVFSVISGPHAGAADTTVTDDQGQTLFTILGDGRIGTDTVRVQADLPDAIEEVSALAEVNWINAAPVCDAGMAREVVFEGDPVSVMLDGTASSDPDTSDVLTYLWSIDCDGASFDDEASATPLLTFSEPCGCGPQIVTLTVSDGIEESTCETEVLVLDGVPPVLVPKQDSVSLWPPNHRMHTVTPDMCLEVVTDECDTELDLTDVRLIAVRSDEAPNARGDGNTEPDVEIDCDGIARLRAERAGGGNGRVYVLTYQVVDASGNETTLECRVEVPHDQGGKAVEDDDAVEYEVLPDCD